MQGFDRVEPEIPVGSHVRLRAEALDGYIQEARVKMDRGRTGEVVDGGIYKGSVRVCFPAVGRRKEYKQDLRVKDLELAKPVYSPPRQASGPRP